MPTPVDLAVSADSLQVAVVSPANSRSIVQPRRCDHGGRDRDRDSRSAEPLSSSLQWALFLGELRVERGRGPLQSTGSAFDGRWAANVSAVNGPQLETTAVALRASGELVVQAREPAELHTLKGTIVLSSESRGYLGHELFHVNAGAGLACASCHAEGNDDGRVWNFACSGARRTQSLQTGLRQSRFTGTATRRTFPSWRRTFSPCACRDRRWRPTSRTCR